MRARERFRRFAEGTARMLSLPGAFILAGTGVLVWAGLGPAYHFSERWQAAIGTATSIITFLMVFLLQHTQARDTRAFHLKLDELLRSVQEARTGLVGLEHLPDSHLDELADELSRLGGQERGEDEVVPPVSEPPV